MESDEDSSIPDIKKANYIKHLCCSVYVTHGLIVAITHILAGCLEQVLCMVKKIFSLLT